jgi:hypothetical protein
VIEEDRAKVAEHKTAKKALEKGIFYAYLYEFELNKLN